MERFASPLLTCSRLSLRRGQRQILDELDLTLHCGTLTALLGPNGAGKSTLLKCLTGELPHEGTITLFGRERQLWDSSQLAHRLGVLPQSSS
ncbi:ATP-binding cassette domain-containing protein, partial [Aeromonas sp. HMWF016]|uniref:ATP-binding cassette domain-containing protein n=1 Tax=Aeromonas sp. HMWF016 TaxID=2056852 RepID=UPI002159D3DC